MIKDFKDGDDIGGIFIVSGAVVRETKNGKPYTSLTLSDKSGSIDAKMWGFALECQPGPYSVKGGVESYQGSLQAKVIRMEPARPNADLRDAIRQTALDVDGMLLTVTGAIKRLPDDLQTIVLGVIENLGGLDLFKISAAASRNHQAYQGGLLEHVWYMLVAADSLNGAPYFNLDMDVLNAGIILHDLGKVLELKTEWGIAEYSELGREVGHVGIVVAAVPPVALRNPKFRRVLHLIMSHHGRAEWGATVLPATAEAVVLHHLDMIDSRMAHMRDSGPMPYSKVMGGPIL